MKRRRSVLEAPERWALDADRPVPRLSDELYDTCTVSEELWAELARRYRDDQLLELVVIAGWYRLIAGVLHALRIAREPWAARFPAG